MTEDEIVGWHHRLNGHEFEQAPGDSEGQVWCSPWGFKELYATQQRNNKIPPFSQNCGYILFSTIEGK